MQEGFTFIYVYFYEQLYYFKQPSPNPESVLANRLPQTILAITYHKVTNLQQ